MPKRNSHNQIDMICFPNILVSTVIERMKGEKSLWSKMQKKQGENNSHPVSNINIYNLRKG